MNAHRINADQLMHGVDYSGEQCSGWLAQRKWDGHCALWDGERLLSRDGNVIAAPDWFLEGLPSFPLCCELVAGKEGANHTTSLRRTMNGAEWDLAKLYVFDAPEHEGRNADERMSNAWSVMAAPAHLEFTRSIVLRDRVHLLAELLAVLDAGGEGLMIQQPENPYTAGRTRRMLKVKRQSLHFLPRAKGASASRGSAESRA